MENTINASFFTITSKGPLHVGAGGENFWIIDNLIQRDPATNIPCIYSSSLKGALREYYKEYLKLNSQDWVMDLYEAFGRDKTDSDVDEDSEFLKSKNLGGTKLSYPGIFRFLQSDLLSIPIHDENVIMKRITCDFVKNQFENQLGFFDQKIASTPMDEIYGAGVQTVSDLVFGEKVDDFNLPVVARNHLTDGLSDNLWYEQILPRETRLAFGVIYPNDEKSKRIYDQFETAITAAPVQIGANATIGYGFCDIKKLNTEKI